LQTTSQVE